VSLLSSTANQMRRGEAGLSTLHHREEGGECGDVCVCVCVHDLSANDQCQYPDEGNGSVSRQGSREDKERGKRSRSTTQDDSPNATGRDEHGNQQ
jgi:uncharacterized cupin superfamily protein